MLSIVGVSEATYYYWRKRQQQPQKERQNKGGHPIPGYSWQENGKKISDEQIKEWLLELVAGEESAYGYRKLAICLKRQYKLIINNKKVYRLCKELDILAPQRRIRLKHPRRLAINREVKTSDQLWEIDIKYGYIAGEDRFFYLMCVIDIYDRAIVDYHLGLSCEGKHAAQVIQRALWKRQLFERSEKPIIRTDNGPQFISHIFENACESFGAEHERIPPKTPNKNAHIESFHSRLERECLTKYEFTTYPEAYSVVINYIEFYNQRRIHGSLYDLSPHKFRQQVATGQVKSFIVRV